MTAAARRPGIPQHEHQRAALRGEAHHARAPRAPAGIWMSSSSSRLGRRGPRGGGALERLTVRVVHQLILRIDEVLWFGAEDKLVFGLPAQTVCHLVDRAEAISVAAVSEIVHSGNPLPHVTAVTIADVNQSSYDALLAGA